MIIYEEIEKINKAIASIDRRLNKARTATFSEIQIYDTDESHVLTLDWDEDDSANRTLDFKVNSGNRVIDLSGDLTLTGSNEVESWDFDDGTDLHTIKAVAEPGLGGRLTFGLDETARILVLCDYGDIDVDLGLSIQSVPTFYIFNEDADEKIKINYTSLQSDSSLTISADFLSCIMAADLASGDAFEFKSNANIELTDTDAEQAWMALYPKINQTGTANYIGFLMDVTETAAVGSADMLMALRVATADKFTVDPSGNIGIGTAELTCGSINRASGTLSLEIGGTSVIDILSTYINYKQPLFVNDTSNAKMIMGITINQGAADDEIFTMKSSDISIPFTTQTESDTFALFKKWTATNGGMLFRGFSDSKYGIDLSPLVATFDATKTTAGTASIQFEVYGSSGTTIGNVGANANMFAVRCWKGGSMQSVFIVDEDGDYHYDGADGGAFQDEDDIALLRELEDILTKDKLNKKEAKQKDIYKKYKIVEIGEGIDEEGNEIKGRFVSNKKKTMLLLGAIRQLDERLKALEN